MLKIRRIYRVKAFAILEVDGQNPANYRDHARPRQVVSDLLVDLRGHLVAALVVSHNDVEPNILEFVLEVVLLVVLVDSRILVRGVVHIWVKPSVILIFKLETKLVMGVSRLCGYVKDSFFEYWVVLELLVHMLFQISDI